MAANPILTKALERYWRLKRGQPWARRVWCWTKTIACSGQARLPAGLAFPGRWREKGQTIAGARSGNLRKRRASRCRRCRALYLRGFKSFRPITCAVRGARMRQPDVPPPEMEIREQRFFPPTPCRLT